MTRTTPQAPTMNLRDVTFKILLTGLKAYTPIQIYRTQRKGTETFPRLFCTTKRLQEGLVFSDPTHTPTSDSIE